jgi:hypothetical protein
VIAEMEIKPGRPKGNDRTDAAIFCEQAHVSMDTLERWRSVGSLDDVTFEAKLAERGLRTI